jgi:outer membrane beta-barrel protein
MRSWRKAAVMCIPAAFALTGGAALAAEADEYAPPVVVEKRIYVPAHEFWLGAAYLPEDPFYKAVGPDLSYTWHVTEYWKWEAVRLAAFTTYNTALRNDLKYNAGDANDPYEKASFIISSHAQYVPFYGRYTFMNRGTVHQETYFTAGLALDGWTKPQVPGAPGGGVRPALDFGFGFRWYTSKTSSIKAELMDNVFEQPGGTVSEQFCLTVGVAFMTSR